MKHRTLTVMILCLALLCSACRQITPPATDGTTLPSSEPTATTDPTTITTEPSEAPTQPTTITTEPSEAPTQPSEPILYDPDLTPSDWQPAFQPMSHEDFFKEDRMLLCGDRGWYVAREDGYALATINVERRGLVIEISDTKSIYLIPQTISLAGASLLCADGYYAYMQDGNHILRVDLVTGATETILSADRIWSLRSYGNHVLHYIATVGDTTSVCRMYLPTLTIDTLYDKLSGDIPEYWLHLGNDYKPAYGLSLTTTHSDITWETIHPDMLARLREVLTDKNSPYMDIVPKSFWEYEDIMEAMRHGDIRVLCQAIQDKEGIYPYLKGIYHVSAGTYSEVPGILDNCWCGSGHPVDHFDLNTYDVTPTWNISDSTALENFLSPEDPDSFLDSTGGGRGSALMTDLGDGILRPVCGADGIYRSIVEEDIRSYTATGGYAFMITKNNTILQYEFSTGKSAVIYTAQHGRLQFPYNGYGKLYFIDGDVLMEIDLPAKTCRSLMTVPNFFYMYLDNEQQMYIETARGQSFGGFTCHFTELTIRKGYRL